MTPRTPASVSSDSAVGTIGKSAELHLVAGDPSDMLGSWKEIADFLGRDRRTAMRWEKEGMPVHRVPSGKRGRVFGSRIEISAWLGQQPDEEPPRATPPTVVQTESTLKKPLLFWLILSGAFVILVALAVALRTRQHSGLPLNVRFTENSVQAENATGNPLWTYTFKQSLYPPALRPKQLGDLVRIADFNGDGNREVLLVAPFRLGNNPEDPYQIEVDYFSSSGRRLWSYAPNQTIRFGDHVLTGPWIPKDLLVSHGAKPVIWIAFADVVWGNSYIVRIDPRSGEATLSYVNAGTIHALAEVQTQGDWFLLAGGFNNEHDGPDLAVIDESRAFAASPQTNGTRYRCTSCPSGAPDRYFVFPRSEVNRFRNAYEDAIWIIRVSGDGFTASESPAITTDKDMQKFFSFQLKPAIEPVSIQYSSDYDLLHRTLEKTHELNHTLETCPERLRHAPVKVWTPAAGWSDLPMTSSH